MGSYTISSRFNSLEGFNTQFLQKWISQPNLRIAQIQDKVRMTHKSALKDMQVVILMHYERNKSFLIKNR